ncbi:MAG: hypothetical protein GTO41_05375, partial [Burkholderiales bacterium]|nr:hypothetical protein [Burkholderiales bacterium]
MQNSISQIPRTFLRQLVSVFVVSALLFGILGQGWAQSVNIDIGRNWGPPANAFGAAAGQAGVWNNINAVGTRDIVDLGGATTDIDLTLGPAFEGNASGPPTTDAERLVGDMFYVCRSFPYCGPPSWSVQMTGVENGAYDVYVYAPSHSSVPTGNFTVNGIDVANLS